MKSSFVRKTWLITILATAICGWAQEHANNPAAPDQLLSDTSPGVTPGVIKKKVDPEYPESARIKSIQGAVELSLSTDKKGKVTSVAVISGDPLLAEAAMKAVRKWQYKPSMFEGKAIPVQKRVTLNFVLHQALWKCDGGRPNLADASSNPASGPSPPDDSSPIDAETIDKVGGHVTPPSPVYNPEPEYSKKARAEKKQGTVVLGVVIGSDGNVRNVKELVGLGYDLDQQAVNAVCTWRFTPAKKDGKPVPARITVEVAFRLY